MAHLPDLLVQGNLSYNAIGGCYDQSRCNSLICLVTACLVYFCLWLSCLAEVSLVIYSPREMEGEENG